MVKLQPSLITFAVGGRISATKRAALGDVCISFSVLEFRIEQTIWALRGQRRKIGRLHTRRQMFRKRIIALRSEAKKQFGENSPDYKFFDDVATNAEKLAKDRNFFVHGVWGYGNHQGMRRKTYAISYFDEESGKAIETRPDSLYLLRNNILKLCQVLERGVQQRLGVPLP